MLLDVTLMIPQRQIGGVRRRCRKWCGRLGTGVNSSDGHPGPAALGVTLGVEGPDRSTVRLQFEDSAFPTLVTVLAR